MSTTAEPTTNGRAPDDEAVVDPIGAAIAYEEQIREEALTIRGDQPLSRALYAKLAPLARRPIPPAFIERIGVVKGKPYASTGVRSVQVQIDRMDNVFGPWWRDTVEYHEGGKLAEVTVRVFDTDGGTIVERSSWGGVNQGSTLGNVYKGSYTNAAKTAFARVGPGHEVYLGIADYDPDVNEQAAAEQRPVAPSAEPGDTAIATPEPPVRRLSDERHAALIQTVGDRMSAAADESSDALDAFQKRVALAYTAVGGTADRINAEAFYALTPEQADEFEAALPKPGGES